MLRNSLAWKSSNSVWWTDYRKPVWMGKAHVFSFLYMVCFIYIPADGLPRVRFNVVSESSFVCIFSFASISSIFSAWEFMFLWFMSSITWGFIFCSCCVVLATSFEHPCSKSCFCRMYIFFNNFTKKSDFFRILAAVFGSFTSSHRTKSVCGNTAGHRHARKKDREDPTA